jgi:hypothetical protein
MSGVLEVEGRRGTHGQLHGVQKVHGGSRSPVDAYYCKLEVWPSPSCTPSRANEVILWGFCLRGSRCFRYASHAHMSPEGRFPHRSAITDTLMGWPVRPIASLVHARIRHLVSTSEIPPPLLHSGTSVVCTGIARVRLTRCSAVLSLATRTTQALVAHCLCDSSVWCRSSRPKEVRQQEPLRSS